MNGQVQTVLGAFIASAILFVSSMVTLFAENPELTFGAIKQATWVSIVGGMLIQFLKDYQAVRIRRLMGQKE